VIAASVIGKARRLLRELPFTFGAHRVPLRRFNLASLEEAAVFFDHHGWVLVNLFAPSEIESFRRDILLSEKEGLGGDLLSNPHLARVLLDGRVVQLVRKLLGTQPTYFGDSSWYSSNSHPFALGFHKDNPYKFTQNGPDWDGKYTILRIGIYLQDHVDHSGGLALRDRSHHTTDTLAGQPFAVPSAKGDVVVWSLRTSHSGFVSRPRLFPTVFLPLTVQNLVAVRARTHYGPSSCVFRPLEYPARLALFVSYGAEGDHLRRYIAYLKTRRYAVLLWQRSRYTDALREAVRDHGLLLVDAPAQVRDIDPDLVPEEHHEPTSRLLPSGSL
jgi:hypothetical protein